MTKCEGTNNEDDDMPRLPGTTAPPLIAIIVGLLLFTPIHATPIVVDETTCTLVDAITAANTDAPTGGCPAGSGADMIELTTDVTLTAPNSSYPDLGPKLENNALPIIESDISIEGSGFTIERSGFGPAGGYCMRLFLVLENATLSLQDTTLAYIEPDGEYVCPPCFCSDIEHIRNWGSLLLSNTTLHSYGIHNEGGTAILTDCTVSGGEGIVNDHGSMSMDRCTVSDSEGRGITAVGGDLAVTHSTVSGNNGGIDIRDNGQLNLSHSLVSNNHVALGCCGTGFGGAIQCTGGSNCWVTNSTLSGNSAFEYEFISCNPQNEPCMICDGTCFPLGPGGDIYANGGASVVIANSTLFGDQGGAIRWQNSNAPALANSIVSNTCPGSGLTDLGNNLYADCGSGFDAITGLDPELADNGGPTLTHALLPGSSAIDAGGAECEPTDQRGVLRPQDGDQDGVATCDVGAYEFDPPDSTDSLEELIDTVTALSLPRGIENSLLAKLRAAILILGDLQANNDHAAANMLGAFIRQVQAQYGKKIAASDADALIEAADQIIELLSENLTVRRPGFKRRAFAPGRRLGLNPQEPE